MKDIAVDSETVCLWIVDCSFDRAIKTLCYLELYKVRFEQSKEVSWKYLDEITFRRPERTLFSLYFHLLLFFRSIR